MRRSDYRRKTTGSPTAVCPLLRPATYIRSRLCVFRYISRTSKMRTEITMKSGHRPFAKKGQTTEDIDLEEPFDRYWGSNMYEFTVSSQSRSSTSQPISDG